MEVSKRVECIRVAVLPTLAVNRVGIRYKCIHNGKRYVLDEVGTTGRKCRRYALL